MQEPKYKKPKSRAVPAKNEAVKRKSPVKEVVAEGEKDRIKKSAKPVLKRPGGRKMKRAASLIWTALISAAIVGGAIYAWQNKARQRDVEHIGKEAREARISFEGRLAGIKEKMAEIEKEYEEAKKKNEELEEAEKILQSATKEYINDELGFSFEYPARLGDVEVKMEGGDTGQRFIGTFSRNENLVFGGISQGFVPAASGTKPFINTLGFEDDDGQYEYLAAGGESFNLNPIKEIDTISGTALLVDKKGFGAYEDATDIEQNVGIILNLADEQFTGLAFLNSDFGALGLDDFEDMVKSVEVIEN